MGTLDKAILEGLKSMKICRYVPSSSSLPNFSVSLETVGSYVLELEVNEKRGYSSVTLREVPLFLIEAFNALRERGMNVEGLFRKEGNCARIKNVLPVYMGCTSIPPECTTHDICSMIKRFFRELKTPLFANLQNKLVMIASENEGEERVRKLLDVVRMLPAGHLGTLGFLVRQLKYFGDRHEAHHMTVDNLARVFAPTLFRDDGPPLAVKKKKKGTQVGEHLFSTIRSDNDIKITILKDLIGNAWQVGLPKDYYLASRRPSDRDKARALRSNDEVGPNYLRSSSARPLSRSSFPNVVEASGSHLAKNDRKAEKRFSTKPAEDAKLRRGRRSSSTVRELFSTFSNKVLRRGNSPFRGSARRSSADCGSNIAARGFGQPFAETASIGIDRISKAGSSGVLCSASDDMENVYRLELDIENEEMLEKTLVDERTGDLLEGKSDKNLHPQREGGTPARHRSRRESPRKHLNTNSRVKPTGNSPPKTSASWMPVSPALEPTEMATKRLTEPTVQRKESGEKRLLDGKVLKKSSMKKRGNAVQIAKNDTAASFLEEYIREAGIVTERRRRHTTPVKACCLLKRNQPNTLASGLKAPEVQIRDRRSTTLGFRINGTDDIRLTEKKRRSESLGNDSSGISPDSDEENNTSITPVQTIDISSILEQKNIESRQRRAKRQKRKEAKSQISPEQCSSTGSPSVSLLDDVTNEIERLERERRAACKMEKSTQSTVNPENDRAKAVETSVTEVVSAVPPITSVPHVLERSPAAEQSTPKDVSAAVMRTCLTSSHTKIKAVQAINTSNRVVHAPTATTAQTSTRFVIHSSCNRPTVPAKINSSSVASYLTRKGINRTQSSEPYIEVQQDITVDESEFARSEFYKNEILSKNKENSNKPEGTPVGARPSVVFIQANNKGMVQQRVNQFAQLVEAQAHIVEPPSGRSSRTSRGSQDTPVVSLSSLEEFEFIKPTAPPVTHGLRPAELRFTSSPNCVGTVATRTKKFEEASVESTAVSSSQLALHKSAESSLSAPAAIARSREVSGPHSPAVQ